MNWTISNNRRAAVGIGLACLLTALGSGAQAQATEDYPDIRLTYADIPLDTLAGRRAFVDRVDSTATAHCARYGPRIVPYHLRLQPRFCIGAVRAEILGALPRPLRVAYDDGRRDRVIRP